jgi:hypothetical protein
MINTVSLGAVIGGWAGARSGETRTRYLTDRERTLARMKDVLVAAVTVTGVAVTLRERRSARPLEILGAAQLASTAALAVTNTAIAQVTYRRPPVRRVLFRRY